jgi:predicted MPP superfamily phosphohydrolase
LTASPLTRRKFLKAGAVAAAAGLALDASYLEPDHPRLERVEVRLARLPQQLDGFTIAQLSDFHYDPYFAVTPIKAAVAMLNNLRPDLIVLTGDFVTAPVLEWESALRRAAAAAYPCAELLSGLHAHHGIIAVLGNHDDACGPDGVTEALEGKGIRVLRNQHLSIERDGVQFWVAGLDDVLGGKARVEESLRGIPASDTTVMLCHEPDFADDVRRYPVDLQLSGHSHGGQVRLPLVGAPYLPPGGKQYPWGLRQLGRLKLYTNCGIGTIRIPVRFNCPPEVTLLTLRTGGRP